MQTTNQPIRLAPRSVMESGNDLFYLGIKTLITDPQGTILLLRTCKARNEHWDIPGGRIRIGEQPEETARREIAEETGITGLGPLTFVGMLPSTVRIPTATGSTAGLIFSFYHCTTSQTHVILSPEHQSYAWLPLEEAEQYLTQDFGPLMRTIILSRL